MLRDLIFFTFTNPMIGYSSHLFHLKEEKNIVYITTG